VTTVNDFELEEREPHYFVPNFLRPAPCAEFDPDLNDDPQVDYDSLPPADVSQDALYLVPGMLPEPYWDFNMVCDQYNYADMKKYLNRATKYNLKQQEARLLCRGLHSDPELVFHIDMTPAKLPDLLISNP